MGKVYVWTLCMWASGNTCFVFCLCTLCTCKSLEVQDWECIHFCVSVCAAALRRRSQVADGLKAPWTLGFLPPAGLWEVTCESRESWGAEGVARERDRGKQKKAQPIRIYQKSNAHWLIFTFYQTCPSRQKEILKVHNSEAPVTLPSSH